MSDAIPAEGQILLTDREFDLAVESVRCTGGPSISALSAERIIREVFSVLNRARCGAPAGEVRRRNDNSLAIRVQRPESGRLRWEVPHLNGDRPTAEDMASWETIHRTSWNNRLTESDYKPKNGNA